MHARTSIQPAFWSKCLVSQAVVFSPWQYSSVALEALWKKNSSAREKGTKKRGEVRGVVKRDEKQKQKKNRSGTVDACKLRREKILIRQKILLRRGGGVVLCEVRDDEPSGEWDGQVVGA